MAQRSKKRACGAGSSQPAPRRRKKNPAELVVMLANPSQQETEDAGELYKEFHGRAPKHVDTYHMPSPRPATLTELGDLIELRIKRDHGWKWGELQFRGKGIKVASNAAGTQLYFVGGDQRISRGQLTKIGVDNAKDLIDLGECRYIAYRAKKDQVNGIPSDYEHGLGEVTGVAPRLQYDRRGPSPVLYLVGGEYRVEGVGIVN